MSNPDGVDFEAIVNLPGLVVMSTKDPQAVIQVMTMVRDGIFKGTMDIVYKQPMQMMYKS